MFLRDTDLVIKICQFMATITNAENLKQYDSTIFRIVEQMFAFTLGTNFIRKVKNVSPNFNQNASKCFTL